ncbi:unnamed protein product, partial [marine sediment metagenome]
TNFTEINDTMKKMVKALYKVPSGYYLGGSKSKIDQSSTWIKNMDLNAKGSCSCMSNFKK